MFKIIRLSLLLLCFFLILFTNNAFAESWREGKIILVGEVKEWKDPATRPTSMFVMDADGSNFARICDLNVISSKGYSLSPDCQKILFSNKAGKDENLVNDIYIMDIDGHNKTNLTKTDFIHEFSPCWSPEGKQISYTENRLDQSFICVTDLLHKNINKLHEGRSPDWSSKNEIVFYFNGNIWKMNADGSNPMNLTKKGLSGNPWYMRWSPDGNNIIFELNNDIYIMDRDGNNLKNLTNSDFSEGMPCWSPNGEKIAFVSIREDRKNHLYIMNPDGSNIERLINNEVMERETKYLEDWRSESSSSVRMTDLLKTSTWGYIKVNSKL